MTPSIIVSLFLTVVALSFFIWYGWLRHREVKTLTDFFLAPTPPTRMQLISTLASTNTALALTVFWFSFLGWQYGIGAAFWIFLYWLAGLEVWALFTRKLTDYPGQITESTRSEPHFQTLHEYISSRIPGDVTRRLLAVTSIMTFLLMVNVELTRGTNVFHVLAPSQPVHLIELIALVLVLIAAIYAAVGGFRAVMRTDSFQWALSFVALLIALIFCLATLPLNWASLGPLWAISSEFSLLDLFLIPKGIFFILGSFFSWGFWFLVTMDMWQRGAAARNLNMIGRSSRKALYPWFAFVTFTSVLIGLTVRTIDNYQFHPFPAVRFLDIAHQVLGAIDIVGPLLFALLFLGFVSAMISTLDTYILVISHSVFRDLPSTSTRKLWVDQPLRRWMVAIATVGLALAGYPLFLLLSHSNFDINALLYIATSLPFVLLPSVILFKYKALQSSFSISTGVVSGWLGTIAYVFWVLSAIHSSYGNQKALTDWYNLMYIAPLVASLSALAGHVFGFFAGSLLTKPTKERVS